MAAFSSGVSTQIHETMSEAPLASHRNLFSNDVVDPNRKGEALAHALRRQKTKLLIHQNRELNKLSSTS
jgi:hypothetical protein